VRVPWLEYPVEVGRWVCVLVELRGDAALASVGPATVAVEADGDGRWNVRALWPDGFTTSTQINENGVAFSATP